ATASRRSKTPYELIMEGGREVTEQDPLPTALCRRDPEVSARSRVPVAGCGASGGRRRACDRSGRLADKGADSGDRQQAQAPCDTAPWCPRDLGREIEGQVDGPAPDETDASENGAPGLHSVPPR